MTLYVGGKSFAGFIFKKGSVDMERVKLIAAEISEENALWMSQRGDVAV